MSPFECATYCLQCQSIYHWYATDIQQLAEKIHLPRINYFILIRAFTKNPSTYLNVLQDWVTPSPHVRTHSIAKKRIHNKIWISSFFPQNFFCENQFSWSEQPRSAFPEVTSGIKKSTVHTLHHRKITKMDSGWLW